MGHGIVSYGKMEKIEVELGCKGPVCKSVSKLEAVGMRWTVEPLKCE
jgi:hypothetical protein